MTSSAPKRRCAAARRRSGARYPPRARAPRVHLTPPAIALSAPFAVARHRRAQLESARALLAGRDETITQLRTRLAQAEAHGARGADGAAVERHEPQSVTPPRSPGKSPANTPVVASSWFGSSGGKKLSTSKQASADAAGRQPSPSATAPGRSSLEHSAAEKLARERLREAELALETQQRMYKAHIADLTTELGTIGVGASTLGSSLAEMDGELARKEERLRSLRADLEQLTALLTHSQRG